LVKALAAVCTVFYLDDHAACGHPGQESFTVIKRGRTMKTRVVDVVEATCEVLPASALPAAIRRRESVHATMTVRRSADVYNESPDKDSSEASVSDDAHALSAQFLQLYERFRRPIHSYIYRLLGSQEDADDVTQEVFVRVFTAWEGLYDRDNLSAWLYRIATNLSVDLLRRRKHISLLSLTLHKRGDEHFHGALSDESFFLPPDDGGIPAIAEREHIRLAIANMPEEYAAALVLNAVQGVPYQEVAAMVSISPNAAATRISRAKKMFVEHYQRGSCIF